VEFNTKSFDRNYNQHFHPLLWGIDSWLFYMKLRSSLCNHRSFEIRCGRSTMPMLRPCRL